MSGFDLTLFWFVVVFLTNWAIADVNTIHLKHTLYSTVTKSLSVFPCHSSFVNYNITTTILNKSRNELRIRTKTSKKTKSR